MIAAVTPMHDARFEGRGAWRGVDFAGPAGDFILPASLAMLVIGMSASCDMERVRLLHQIYARESMLLASLKPNREKL